MAIVITLLKMVSRLLPHWIFGMVTHYDHSRVPDTGVCRTRHGRDQTWGTNRPNNCSFFIETWPPPLNAATGPWWFSNWNCRWEYPCAPKFAECVLVIFATKDSKPETCRNMQNILKSLVWSRWLFPVPEAAIWCELSHSWTTANKKPRLAHHCDMRLFLWEICTLFAGKLLAFVWSSEHFWTFLDAFVVENIDLLNFWQT